jgi:hypothetical protein
VTIQRYYIIDATVGEATRYSSSMQAYTKQEYESLLAECGFGNLRFYKSLGGNGGSPAEYLMVILAQKVTA